MFTRQHVILGFVVASVACSGADEVSGSRRLKLHFHTLSLSSFHTVVHWLGHDDYFKVKGERGKWIPDTLLAKEVNEVGKKGDNEKDLNIEKDNQGFEKGKKILCTGSCL